MMGEHRMTSETQANNNVAGSYTYNADGQRVRRNVGGLETWQVYGLGGELLAEYAASAAPASPQKEYGYRNGQLLVTAEPSTAETVWVEDSVPAGATPAGSGEGWNWTSSNPPPASGSVAHQSNIVGGMHQHYFYNATSTLSVAAGEKLFAYVYLDPANVPSEVMLQWNDGTWEHRAYWGANNIGWGVNGTESRRSMGTLPATGGWVRLEVAASLVGLEGHTLNGMAFTLCDGRATWDRAGKSATSWTTANFQWLVTDQLGTPRMVFDKTGALATVKRHDYLPFGEELSAGQGARSNALGYGAADGVRQKFTQKERDNETGLDYFGARYFSSTQGRFTSTDPIYFQAMMAIDPQRFNLYSHTRNNPLRYVDPSGERLQASGSGAMGVLYQMVGGQDNFDQYFVVIDGEVLPQPGVSFAGANAGITQLLELVNAKETYRVYAGDSGEEAARLFEGAVGKDGKLNDRGKDLAGRFNGGGNRITGVGTLGGTSGRTDQPAALANGDPVFAVIAINTNVIMTQEAISNDYKEARGDSMATVELGAQTEGVGQRVKAVSYVLHETAENLVFADQRTHGKPYDYSSAHIAAMHREAQVRRDLGITGGFAGGEIKTEMPKKTLMKWKRKIYLLIILATLVFASGSAFGRDATISNLCMTLESGVKITVAPTRNKYTVGDDVVLSFKIFNPGPKAIYMVRKESPEFYVDDNYLLIEVPEPLPIDHGNFDYNFLKIPPGKKYQGTTRIPGNMISKANLWRFDVGFGFVTDTAGLWPVPAEIKDPAPLRSLLASRLSTVVLRGLVLDIR